MIVANLYFIKSTSGLFYYGVDYLTEHPDLLRKVLVRPALEQAARTAFPVHDVVVCSALRMLREAARAALRGDVVYTPTSHPLPFLSKQWTVVHDAYPFAGGWRCVLKKLLLRWSLATSRCRVAHINQTDARAFVLGLGVDAGRLLFAPNRFPNEVQVSPRPPHVPGQSLVVALVGTESKKKNYEALFSAVMQAGAQTLLRFHIYGHRNTYLQQLETQFPAIRIQVLASDTCGLSELFASVHVLASVARQEGFGRPMAGALLAGVPCLLLRCPVFSEFFDPGAEFFSAEADLVQALLAYAKTDGLKSPVYAAPAAVIAAYQGAVTALRMAGSVDLEPAH